MINYILKLVEDHNSLRVHWHSPINDYLFFGSPFFFQLKISNAALLWIWIDLVQNLLNLLFGLALLLQINLLNLAPLVFLIRTVFITIREFNDVEKQFVVCNFIVQEVVITKVLKLAGIEHFFCKSFLIFTLKVFKILFFIEVIGKDSLCVIFIFFFVYEGINASQNRL